jgi:hypothetical protein
VDEVPSGGQDVPDAGAQEVDEDLYADGHDDQEDNRHANLHPDDPGNFFKLSHFLKISLAHSLTDKELMSQKS